MAYIPHMLMEKCLSERGFVGDHVIKGIRSYGCNYLICLHRSVIHELHGYGIVDTHLIFCGLIVNDGCGLDHLLEVIDSGIILPVESLGSVLLEIIGSVTLCGCFSYVIDSLGTNDQFSVFYFLFHLLDVGFCKLIVHLSHHSQRYERNQYLKDHKSVYDLSIGPASFFPEMIVEGSSQILHKALPLKHSYDGQLKKSESAVK